jgi:hypothetical protein
VRIATLKRVGPSASNAPTAPLHASPSRNATHAPKLIEVRGQGGDFARNTTGTSHHGTVGRECAGHQRTGGGGEYSPIHPPRLALEQPDHCHRTHLPHPSTLVDRAERAIRILSIRGHVCRWSVSTCCCTRGFRPNSGQIQFRQVWPLSSDAVR